MKVAFIVASNSEEVLKSSLLASPDLARGVEINIQRGAKSAAEAYNRGMVATQAEAMVFVHQDVYLPAGWMEKLERAVARLEKDDGNWGVLGLFGTQRDGTGQGHVYSTGLGRMLGEAFEGAREVETLDEVMLILRRASGLRFDAEMGGFHLYGGDICLQAAERGMRSYAISALCVHNTNGIRMLPGAYWRNYLYMRRKWRGRLPVSTPCMPVTRWGGPAWRYLIQRPVNLALRRARPGRRVAGPWIGVAGARGHECVLRRFFRYRVTGKMG